MPQVDSLSIGLGGFGNHDQSVQQILNKSVSDSEDPEDHPATYPEKKPVPPVVIEQVKHTENIVDSIQRKVTLIESKLSRENLNDEVPISELIDKTVPSGRQPDGSTEMGTAMNMMTPDLAN